MRVARHNGTNWVELNSAYTAGSDAYNGSAETNTQETITSGSSGNFTLACVNAVKPRIRLAPTGPICGDAGIPIVLSSSYPTYSPYTVYYTRFSGDATQTLTPAPTSFPATLPTDAAGGVYKLVGFKYHNSFGAELTGAWDATEVTAYQPPSIAVAGSDQSHCGGTTATLDATAPAIGTGLWSIITSLSGSGGSVTEPTNAKSPFVGLAGNSYFIKWTVSNGTCTKLDTVKIAFPLMPAQPLNFIASTNPVCQGNQDVIYTVPNDPLINSYTWNYDGTGAAFSSTINTVSIDYSLSATSGLLSVTATNDCGISDARTLSVTVNPTSTASITDISTATTCEGDAVVLTLDIASKVSLPGPGAPFHFTLRQTNPDATYTETTINSTDLSPVSGIQYEYTINPLWLDQGGATPGRADYIYTISNLTDGTTCIPVLSGSKNLTVWKTPETGPEYHVPNTFGF